MDSLIVQGIFEQLAPRNTPNITVHDELITDYVLDTDVVVDGRREWYTSNLSLASECAKGSDYSIALPVGLTRRNSKTLGYVICVLASGWLGSIMSWGMPRSLGNS